MLAVPKLALITIGTEVVTGQIVNTNASFLAQELCEMDWELTLHLTVADDREAMLEAFAYAASKAEVLILTGGLGPTRDDFTRDVVAEWAETPLAWNEDSWQRIITRLGEAGVKVAEANRIQCYFPQGAKIYVNEHGTANAFSLFRQQTQIYCLPGPPSEIKGLWKDGLRTELDRVRNHSEAKDLILWQILGISEAKLGEIVEAIIKDSGLVSGYRPHLPYIELKIWVYRHEKDTLGDLLRTLDKAVRPWTYSRDGVDVLVPLFEAFNAHGRPIMVIDRLCKGAMARRLGIGLEKLDLNPPLAIFHNEAPKELSREPMLVLEIEAPDQEGQFAASITLGSRQQKQSFKPHFKYRPEAMERFRSFAVEMVLHFWKNNLI